MTLSHDPSIFARNMAKVAEQSQRIISEFLGKQPLDKALDPNPMYIGSAFAEMFSRMMADPGKVLSAQFGLWQDYLGLMHTTAQRFLGEQAKPFIEPDSRDKRFKDNAWQESVVFDFIKQSYLLSARWMQQSVQDVEGLDPKTVKKIDFYTRQFVDAMAPSNFLMTNPEVLKATIDSNGENLVKGLENMLDDLEHSKDTLRVSMTDLKAFEVGKNLATTKGKVVFENDLMQLIEFTPLTEKVYETPVLVIPAWINKYYILDLQPENSVVRWFLERGHNVFVISWVNPDEKLGRKSFEDYLLEGPLAALDAIEKSTGAKSVSAVGYCLGGTLLSITLAWLHSKKQANRIASATYLTTMTDFSEAGELSVFIDEEQLQALENRMSQTGYLEGGDMSITFNMLRANDLIWSFVVNNYLLGKDPFPFDLLYWNSDSTRMPATMHSYYLRNMYQNNLLVKPGGITLAGVPIDITSIKTPTYILSTREDHIAPWKSTYAATQLYKGPIKFVLAASGHIAGVVNPPAKKKYCYWTGKELPKSADDWFAKASEVAGSWWPDWHEWQMQYAGDLVPARKPGGGKLKPIEDAPGKYVKVKA